MVSSKKKRSIFAAQIINLLTISKTMTTLTICLLILAVVLTLVGIVGAIAPALPGPPLSLVALIIVYFALPGTISLPLVITMTILCIVAAILDYFAPILITRVGGGSREAVLCTSLGLLAGLFFMPAGLIVGPLVGAFIGEYSHSAQIGKALRIAFLSFLSFVLTTVIKLILTVLITYYIIMAIVSSL